MQPITFRHASATDLPLIMEFIAQAKQHLKQQSIDQWQDGYPSITDIEADILSQTGYVICTQSTEHALTPIGYLCISPAPEPAYQDISEGNWQSQAPYYVVHRLTIGDTHKGKGLASHVFTQAANHCLAHQTPYIRIDTHPDNHKMQHVLQKNGFVKCGIVWYASGLRLAYDKII